jgi:shikimate dehydrogenase
MTDRGTSPPLAYAAGLIGAGIGRSFSPALHEREARELGLTGEYRLFDIETLHNAP